MNYSILVSCATLGPCGYLRGSGTLTTLLTLPFIYWLSGQSITQGTYLFLVTIFCGVSLVCIRRALTVFRRQADPSQIVVDEIVGSLMVYMGRAVNGKSLLIGFLLFRFFDIFKPLGIKKVELLPGEWGIMLDDIVAGLLANGVLWVLGW